MSKIQIPKKLRGEDGHCSFSLRIPVSLCKEIDHLVAQTELSRNDFLNRLIKEAIKEVELIDFEKE